MNTLKYKGFLGSIEYSEMDKCYFGEVLGLDRKTCITFEGDTLYDLEDDFRKAIDYHLDFCKRNSIKPQKSYSGVLNLQLPVKEYLRLAGIAERTGTSVNEIAIRFIEEGLQATTI
ncbi:MAG: type II toxin-antitoxin system HicB family antitoxin [Bacteroidales bacterium]|jgi:predicted HicB family RNase H-like nuclease|nr:type II toxin-antitoxin system HicB family antitoxin [Bacteroidales bacterium]